MQFCEALLEAHSDESTEPALIADILRLLDTWEEIESLPNDSAKQLKCTESARVQVEALRVNWQLSDDEIFELDQHTSEFRQLLESPAAESHQAAS